MLRVCVFLGIAKPSIPTPVRCGMETLRKAASPDEMQLGVHRVLVDVGK